MTKLSGSLLSNASGETFQMIDPSKTLNAPIMRVYFKEEEETVPFLLRKFFVKRR